MLWIHPPALQWFRKNLSEIGQPTALSGINDSVERAALLAQEMWKALLAQLPQARGPVLKVMYAHDLATLHFMDVDRVYLERLAAIQCHAHKVTPGRASCNASNRDLVAVNYKILRLPLQVGDEFPKESHLFDQGSGCTSGK